MAVRPHLDHCILIHSKPFAVFTFKVENIEDTHHHLGRLTVFRRYHRFSTRNHGPSFNSILVFQVADDSLNIWIVPPYDPMAIDVPLLLKTPEVMNEALTVSIVSPRSRPVMTSKMSIPRSLRHAKNRQSGEMHRGQPSLSRTLFKS